MTTTYLPRSAAGAEPTPKPGLTALLDQIAHVKFSTHVPLVVVLSSGVYAIYRSTHWLMAQFGLGLVVAAPTSIFLEALVLGAGASVFLSYRMLYIALLQKHDTGLARIGARLSIVLLVIAFLALLGVAGADAWLLTHEVAATVIMVLAQATQAGMLIVSIVWALFDERTLLRREFAEAARVEAARVEAERRAEEERARVEAERARVEAQARAHECRYCHKPMAANNRARHERTCPARPGGA